MPYSNYGQIGDVWKHLPLLDVLSIEKPDVYYETNAAYSTYQVETVTEKQKSKKRFLSAPVFLVTPNGQNS